MSPMHVALSLAQSLALVIAGTPADPRTISPEANQPSIEVPSTWSTPSEPVAPKEPPAPELEVSKQPDKIPQSKAPFVPRPQRECWTTKSQCRQLSITGIVLGALGLASVGTGTALVLLPPNPIEDEPAYERSTKPPGVVAIGMGVGVLVTGILMLVAGQRGWKLGLDRAFQDADRGARR